jgi:hypothetical protein
MFAMSHKEAIRFCSIALCFVSDLLRSVERFDTDFRRQSDPGRRAPEAFPGMTGGPAPRHTTWTQKFAFRFLYAVSFFFSSFRN